MSVLLTLIRRWHEADAKADMLQQQRADGETYSEDGAGVEPLNTDRYASSPRLPIEKLDAAFRGHLHGDPTL